MMNDGFLGLHVNTLLLFRRPELTFTTFRASLGTTLEQLRRGYARRIMTLSGAGTMT
jgi:hypothetical protein